LRLREAFVPFPNPDPKGLEEEEAEKKEED